MYQDQVVLCGASAYEQKYYLNEDFKSLPSQVQDELKIMCVLFTEDVGGILTLVFDEDGKLLLETSADEGDLLYDEIGSELKIRQIRKEKAEFQKPYSITDDNNCWKIEGKQPKTLGGNFTILIAKKDGQVLHVIHTK